MPVYNRQAYVGEAIESLLRQSYTDFEIIILDDYSSDQTREVIRSYEDKRIRLIEMPCKTNIPILRNYGIKLAQGEFIAFLDSDDRAVYDRFEKQVNYLDEHPQCGVVGASYQFFGAIDRRYDLPQSDEAIVASLPFRNPIANGSSMIRKSILDQSQIRYRAEYYVCEDYALWVDLMPHTQFHNLADILLESRAHPEQITMTSRRNPSQRFVRQAIINQIQDLSLSHVGINLEADSLVLFHQFLGDAKSRPANQTELEAIETIFESILSQMEAQVQAKQHLNARVASNALLEELAMNIDQHLRALKAESDDHLSKEKSENDR